MTTEIVEVGPKTKSAIEDLRILLKTIGKSKKVSDDMFSRLHMWKVLNKTVARRQPLRPYTEWLNEVLADGKIDGDEHMQFVERASDLERLYENCMLVTKEDLMDRRGVFAPDAPWRNHPASDRQIRFLRDLGVSAHGLTKGQASDLIDQRLVVRQTSPEPKPIHIEQKPPQENRILTFLKWLFR